MRANSVQHPKSNPARAFLDFFLCPSQFARFRVANEAAAKPGAFRLGPAICFGNAPEELDSISRSRQLLEASSAIQFSDFGEVCLPFDPSELISSLRLERYLSRPAGELLLHTYYYLLRPMLPFAIRKTLQRWVSRRRRAGSFPAWPVDCTVEQILEQLMLFALRASGREEIPFIWFWPEGHKGAMMMTHDVEEQKGADHCEFLMDLDDSYGMKAAFQLIPEGAYRDFEVLAARIRRRGFEVNIHDLDHDGRLYEHKELFEQRARKINDYGRQHGAKGFRAGSMHRNQEWFDMLEFQYDMSVPNVSHLEPQSGGCCTVMPYFVGKVLELPLTTIQDHGMFYILSERSIELWKQQMEIILAHHGLISFIVHPDYITRSRECQHYEALLDHISHLRTCRSIWVALPGEINRWWRERSNMELVGNVDSWQVRGQGSERARVAFASVVDGVLRYRLAARDETSMHPNSSARTNGATSKSAVLESATPERF